MTDEHKNTPLETSTIEIRIQMKEAGRRKGMDELLKEASEKLRDQCDLDQDRPRLVKYRKRGDGLILKYQILRGHKLTREEEHRSPYK